MNLQIIKQNKHNFLVLLTIVIFTGCWDFLSVDQPDIADPNSFFDVPITISLTAEPDSGRGYFGILLPNGWTAEDSIAYSGVHNGTFIYSSAYSDSMENYNPAPSNYYWWICVGDSVDSLKDGTISLTPRIYTDSQTGTFFLEYMISDRIEGFSGWVINSGPFPISIDAPMTLTVTNTNDSGPGSLRQALSDVSNTGEILFNLAYPATIVLDSQLVINRNVTITGPDSGEVHIKNITNMQNKEASSIFQINENLNNVRLTNLKVSGGNSTAIKCERSNLEISNVFISKSPGVGVHCNYSTVQLNEVIIDSCLGGGLYSFHSNLNLSKVLIADNSATGIDCGDGSMVYMTNCTVVKNNDANIGGIDLGYESSVYFINSILRYNGIDLGTTESVPATSSIIIAYSNRFYFVIVGDIIINELGGNIEAEPMFADTTNGDYRLQAGSPCIDAGTAFFEFGGDTLLNLHPWQYNGTAPDMGAYEFGPPVGITEESINPNSFSLNQNYPNPFNPSTTIEFSIPKSEFVTLKIYNILGEEVATLVSNKLTVGKYKYDWDASGFASGVYYYKIDAGKYSDVRKMIVLK